MLDAPRADVAVVGTLNWDRTVRVAHLPARGETVLGDDVRVAPGGKGANQAVAAARQGARTTLVGCVGDDATGTELLDALTVEPGLDLEGVRRSAGPTGSATITVDAAGGNTIVSVPGANAQLDESAVHRWGAKIGGAKVLLTQLGVPLDGVRAALEIARSVGTITVLDPSPPDEVTDELLRLADVVTPNETEAERLTGLEITTVDDAVRAAEALVRRGCASAVVTLADRGAVWVAAERAPVVVPPFAVSVMDPTAAGDAFAGALGASLARGDSMADALVDAAAAGALAVTRAGAVPSLPARAAVLGLTAAPR